MPASLHLTTESQFSWTGYTLILPSVGISHVGQMAVDMLLFNLKDTLKRVSDIYDEAILPLVGIDVDGTMCQCLEVYQSEDLKLVVLQQRAPFVKGRIPAFRSRLLQWVRECQFGKVVMLSGVSSHVRTDAELNAGSPFRFLCTNEELRVTCNDNFKWSEYSIKKTLEHKESLELPGSGILKSLYEDCKNEGIPFLAMLTFCNQGDATNEVYSLIQELQKLYPQIKPLKTSSGKWVQPPSWRLQQDCTRLMMF